MKELGWWERVFSCKGVHLVSTSKPGHGTLLENGVLFPSDWKWVTAPHELGFTYLGALFTSKGKMEHEINRWIGTMSAAMQTLYWIVIVKRVRSARFTDWYASNAQAWSWALGNDQKNKIMNTSFSTKWISFAGWLASPLEMVWGSQTSRRNSE